MVNVIYTTVISIMSVVKNVLHPVDQIGLLHLGLEPRMDFGKKQQTSWKTSVVIAVQGVVVPVIFATLSP